MTLMAISFVGERQTITFDDEGGKHVGLFSSIRLTLLRCYQTTCLASDEEEDGSRL